MNRSTERRAGRRPDRCGVLPALASIALAATALGGWPAPAGAHISYHDVTVSFDLAARRLRAVDRITLAVPARSDTLPPGFFLARSLAVDQVRLDGRPVAIIDPDTTVHADWGGAATRFVRLELPARRPKTLVLEVVYAGVIDDRPAAPEQEYAKSFEDSNGLVDSLGIFLAGSSAWVPEVPGSLFGFRLAAELPPGYRSMSQGMVARASASGGSALETWISEDLQEEIYLIAGRYVVTERDHKGVLIQTFLYADDPELAERYLGATADYLDIYQELVGPYPFRKFALVENFWQTGFGMPSFTLLGDRVIRLPFIVTTSYGHEIVHNWFGNSVYVDWEKGNWCEGLTSYLADHLYKEQDGQGAEYRRATLQAYRDFVRGGKDIPLSSFRSRNNPITQAVGYGKAMMTFHMLRLRIGDEAFRAGLSRLATSQRFKRASWGDVRQVFEGVSGLDLSDYFAEWVTRPGAPELALGEPRVTPMPDGFLLEVEIRQATPPYQLEVPLAVLMAGAKVPEVTTVSVADTVTTVSLELAREPLGIALDPSFDIFRRLDRTEIPPSLGQAFGAERTLIVVPTAEPAPLATAYQDFAASFSGAAPGTVEVRDDQAVSESELTGRAVWLLGATNRLRPRVAAALSRQARALDPLASDSLRLGGQTYARTGRTAVAAVTSEVDPEEAWVVIITDTPTALAGLGRKLPHYRKYGYLVFEGEEPANIAKGEWRTQGSPLVRLLDGALYDPPATAPDPTAVPPAAPLIARRRAGS
jgi:hypothetical protein